MYSQDVLKVIMEGQGFEKIHEEEMPLIIREHQRKYQYIAVTLFLLANEGFIVSTFFYIDIDSKIIINFTQ